MLRTNTASRASLLLAALCCGAVAKPAAAQDEASPFVLACVGAGGTAGFAQVRNGSSRVLLYAGGAAGRLSLTLAPSSAVHYIELAVTGQPQGEPANPTIRPGEGRILAASKLEIASLGGTVGKGVEYCLRPV